MRSGSSDSPVAPRHTATQRRLLTAFAGVGVVALTGVAFVLSYDDLRALALAGRTAAQVARADRAGAQYAPAYPIMYDALIVVTILSLLVARNARWWSRWTRWLLLLLLLTGAAAASIQRAIHGYDSLPDQMLVAGVAAAPHVMLVIAVWLWLAMFRHARSALTRRAAQPRLAPVAQVADEMPAVHGGYQVDYRDSDLVPGMRAAEESAEYGEPATAEIADFTEFDDADPSVRILRDANEPTPYPESRHGQPDPPRPRAPEDEGQPAGLSNEPPAESDDTSPAVGPRPEPEPSGSTPRPATLPPGSLSSSPSSGVRLVARTSIIDTPATRPNTIVPHALDSAEDDVDAPAVERAEDPDAGDDEPTGGLRLQPGPWATDSLGGSSADNGEIEVDIDGAAGIEADAAHGGATAAADDDGDGDGDVEIDIERWSTTATEDVQQWADDAADHLFDDDSNHPAEERRTDLEWPPSSTFRSSPTPPTG